MPIHVLAEGPGQCHFSGGRRPQYNFPRVHPRQELFGLPVVAVRPVRGVRDRPSRFSLRQSIEPRPFLLLFSHICSALLPLGGQINVVLDNRSDVETRIYTVRSRGIVSVRITREEDVVVPPTKFDAHPLRIHFQYSTFNDILQTQCSIKGRPPILLPEPLVAVLDQLATDIQVILVQPALHAQIRGRKYAVLVRPLNTSSNDLPRSYLAIVTTRREPLEH
mmetsp:Transcript_14471/g.41226  ORF Transcript_14471/g.41226 Transcript_14471/m.41226 type:complete len:221 (-) Transcript_14471:2313-2975(-)